MKVPQYIMDALRKRAKAAYNFSDSDLLISDYLSKNNIKVSPEDVYGGVEALYNPDESNKRIIKAIENAESTRRV